ncbi:YqgE/AlgH family protein [Photobacterium swingsii]|uniref:YqgE/AlgH family protein n=1 Tax=Photobacterium swingsii TaxID=680026 RepID=UPI003D12FE26
MDLTNHFLIAMPSLQDSSFKRSVVYVCEHNDEGAMGVVVNVPIDISLTNMLEQLDLERSLPVTQAQRLDQPVFNGGPVSSDRGFVLHNHGGVFSSSIQVTPHLSVTTSKDILAILGSDDSPEKFLVALGYAGWDAGQLEQELVDNHWLTIEADPAILFDTPINERWQKAVAKLGINAANLSIDKGHA